MSAALSVSAGVRLLAAVLVLTSPAYAATFYVATNGNDANPGTLELPLATPARALSLAAAGDTILMRGGTYTISKTLQIVQRGLAFRSYPGERARLVADTADLSGLTSVLVVYSGHVTIENLELQGGSYYGIKLDEYYGPQPGITIRGVYIHHTGRDGIKVQQADAVVIEDSEVAFTGVRDPSNADGIDIMGSLVATVRRNYVHDIATTGIYIKAGTRDGVIEANRVERTGYAGILLGSESGAEFMRDGALYEAINSVARNNIVIDAKLAGLGSISGDNVRFENNTVINAASGGQAVFRAAPNAYNTQPRNIVLRNNVFVLAPASTRPLVHLYNYSGAITSDFNRWFSTDGRYQFWRESSSGPNNYWSGLDGWRSGMNADWASLAGDPLLDAAALYRPTSGSPVIDAGEHLADVATDYGGTARPQGITHDIGAHEQPVATTTSEPAPTEPESTETTESSEPVAQVPSAPADLTATSPARATIALTWTDTSADEQGFRIERAVDRGGFVLLATVAAGARAYTDTAVKPNKKYTYRVAAFNAAGTSALSNTATATARK